MRRRKQQLACAGRLIIIHYSLLVMASNQEKYVDMLIKTKQSARDLLKLLAEVRELSGRLPPVLEDLAVACHKASENMIIVVKTTKEPEQGGSAGK